MEWQIPGALSPGNEAHRLLSLESVRQDVRHALRGFRREPGIALIAMVILALGIGANTAVFSIVNPLRLRSLPFPVMGDTLRLAVVGIALGTAISLALARVINSLLFATSAVDPLTFAVMVLVLGALLNAPGGAFGSQEPSNERRSRTLH